MLKQPDSQEEKKIMESNIHQFIIAARNYLFGILPGTSQLANGSLRAGN